MRPRTSAAVSFCWVPSLMQRAIYVRPVGIFPAPAGSGDEHAWKNVGDTPATYYLMRLKTEATPVLAAN